jgi:hypothetical protein
MFTGKPRSGHLQLQLLLDMQGGYSAIKMHNHYKKIRMSRERMVGDRLSPEMIHY